MDVAKRRLTIQDLKNTFDKEKQKYAVATTCKDVCKNEIYVLQCTSDYPAAYHEINLKAMLTIREKLGCIVGFSDHSIGSEAAIAAVSLGAKIIEKHPEYQDIIKNLEDEYFPEQGKTNPFLHINLHLSLQDQLSLDQPRGIQKIYNDLFKKTKDSHQAEHIMMEQIAEMIFISQKYNKPMDLQNYLESLKKLVKS